MSRKPANESRWIAILLVLILVTVGGITWHAQRTFDAHGEVAVAVLADYAELAADQFARQAMAATGYYGYYTSLNALRSGTEPVATPGTTPVLQAFEFERTTGSTHPDADVASELTASVAGPPTDSGFAVRHILQAGKQRTFAVSWVSGEERVLGFEVDPNWVETTLTGVFRDSRLLPESLADGQLSNGDLYLRFDDAAGNIVFESGTQYAAAPTASRQLGDDYSGVFLDHRITVAIDPGQADKLLIGGLPKSRLPLLIAVFLGIGLLLVAAIRQLQREAALVRMRSDFVAEVSHELRTPLTQIRMFTESLMLERLVSTADRERALQIVHRETQRLIHMVENILRFARADKGDDDLHREPTELEPLVASVIEEFQDIANAKEVEIELVATGNVVAPIDRNALRQILINLIDNAVKYGPSGQTIRIGVNEVAGRAIIDVSDSGPGIPPRDRERIWDDYVRLRRERESAIAGTGIGLAVVSDLVRRHGGAVRVDAADGGGARFIVELPL